MTIRRESLKARRVRDLRVGMAQIDNLIVGDPQISGVGAAKLIAESILGNKIYVGGTSFELDGGNVYLLIKDTQGTPVTRIRLGKMGAATTDFGLKIWGADGSLQWDLTGASTQGIQNNAVTLSASNSNDAVATATSAWVVVGQVVINATGNLPVAVWGKMEGASNVGVNGEFRLVHNESATVIDYRLNNLNNIYEGISLLGIHTPSSAGTATYNMEIRNLSTQTTYARYRRVVCIELKR